MSRIASILLITIVLGLSPSVHAEPKTIEWDALIPEDWNPNSVFDQYTDEQFAELPDDVYLKLQDAAQKAFDEAPTVSAYDGDIVKIPGFILPLEFDGTNMSEFLLVPYFGACIHTPPPPANQIIHANLENPVAMNELFTPVWITGKLRSARQSRSLSEAGYAQSVDVESGYAMDVDQIEPYKE